MRPSAAQFVQQSGSDLSRLRQKMAVEGKTRSCEAAGHEDCTRSSRLLFALTSVQGLFRQGPWCREVARHVADCKEPPCQHDRLVGALPHSSTEQRCCYAASGAAGAGAGADGFSHEGS